MGGRRTQEEASQDQGRCPLNTHRQGVDEVHLFWEAALAQKAASLGGFFQKETAVKPVGLAQVFLICVFSPLELSALSTECLSRRAGLGQSQGPRQASVGKLRRAAGVRTVGKPLCHQNFQPEFTLATSDRDPLSTKDPSDAT